jgi:hypothetical protein
MRHRVNDSDARAAVQNARFHSMWWLRRLVSQYVAVNEFELAASRRFGRDSFQTRSTT